MYSENCTTHNRCFFLILYPWRNIRRAKTSACSAYISKTDNSTMNFKHTYIPFEHLIKFSKLGIVPIQDFFKVNFKFVVLVLFVFVKVSNITFDESR